MDKYITDDRTGLKYELVGDYYIIAGDDELEEHPIGIWGQRHLRYLKQNRKTVYTDLLTSGKLNEYLADLNEQAENQMRGVQRMNTVRDTAMEIVNHDLIYA